MTDGEPGLTHLDARGRARMVDVSSKAITRRRAIASARVVHLTDAMGFVKDHPDLLAEARAAGFAAAKQTSRLIPLCHPIPLDSVTIDFAVRRGEIELVATAESIGQTGVEMEAMSAVALAALSILGRARRHAPDAVIEQLGLEEKRGGKSGTWQRHASPPESDGTASQ
jgi:cyclic pyranopterin phosphate synthase